MKLSITKFLLIFCLTAFLSASAFADTAESQMILLPNDVTYFTRDALDDPQPDTIRYDDGSPSLFNPTTNFWTRVRFTAPNNFELRSIYFMCNNPNNNAAACSLIVHASSGGNLGAVLSEHALGHAPSHFPSWNDTNLPTPVTIDAGADFFIVIGPNPGGPQSAGWHVLMDAANVGRSGLSTSGHLGTYSATGGDYMVRAGGAAEAFIDLAASECYNRDSGDDPVFFMQPDEVLTLHAQIANTGNTDVTDYVVGWAVNDPNDVQIFSEEILGTDLPRGEIIQHEATGTVTVTEPGEYIVTCMVTNDDDANPDNDVAMLRFFVIEHGAWYRYDDDDDADSYVGFTAGNGWAISFKPVSYTAGIETLRVNFGDAGNPDLDIFLNDASGVPDGDPIWSGEPAAVAGWNTFVVDPPIDIFAGQSFTVRYLYSDMSLGKDEDEPICAAITNMGVIAYSSEGGQWFEDNAGNWCIQVYLDSSDTVPTFPVIAVNQTTLDFGEVNVGGSLTIPLSITNEGGGDDLVVGSFSFAPPLLRTVMSTNPANVTVPAGQTVPVDIIFEPIAVREFNGTMTLNNNSINEPQLVVQILAEGVPVSAEIIETGIPTEYTLAQNFPNPFNPATEIQFALPVTSAVSLVVFNSLGQEITTLVDETLSAGVYRSTFDASALPSGLYFYRLDAGSFTEIRKMMLLK